MPLTLCDEPRLRELLAAEKERDQLRSELGELAEYARFLLSFVPPWANGHVTPGLPPTFYGTLSEDGDREVALKVEECRELLARVTRAATDRLPPKENP